MNIVLTSAFLQNHFQDDAVPLNIWESTRSAARLVVENPNAFPNALPGYDDQILIEMSLEDGKS